MRTLVKCAIGQWSGCRLERGLAPTLSACTALMIAGCGSGGGMTAAQTSHTSGANDATGKSRLDRGVCGYQHRDAHLIGAALGDTLRFYGLVFNDHGILRMDCAQISSGVTGPSR